MLFELFGLFGVAFILYAAVTRFTTVAALTQMGSIQERTMPWATFSKPSKAGSETERTVLTTGGTSSADRGSSDAAPSSPRALPVKAPEKVLSNVRTWDKFVYTISVVNVGLTAFICGASPQYFYLWHTPKALLYISHRWWTFRQQNQHYLLYDFCYWANALSILYCWVFPRNATMFQVLFVCSNGPLAWSVLAFSQSLIFHSAPHMTSVFIHTSPMLLTFAIRWLIPEPSPFSITEHGDDPLLVSPWDLVINAVTYFYGWWVILYYVWVYIIMGPRIKSRGYKTLFDRVISRGPTRFLAKVSSNDLVQKAAYMLTHFCFAMFTMTLTAVFWRVMWIHIAFVIVIVSVSAWNASGFYFTVFLAKYEEELRARAGIPLPDDKK